MNDSHLFKIARECSFNSDYSGCAHARVGCVIVYKGTILAKGFNSDKTHTSQAHYNKWRYKEEGNTYLPSKIHSEIMALQKIQYLDIDFSKVHIYVYRETKAGKLALAKPCESCRAALKNFSIVNIHYTTPDGYCFERLFS